MNHSQPPLEPLVVPAGAGHRFDLGDHRGQIAVSARSSGGALILADLQADVNGGVPLHVHTHEDETFYVLAGRFAFQVGEQAIEAGPGDALFAPRGLPHAWRCVSAEGGRALFLITPGANFEAFSAAAGQRGFVPSAALADPALRSEFLALAEQHGITFLPPAG